MFSDLDKLVLLQITIIKRHNINLRGLKELCKSLPATVKNIKIVFVILEDRISEYSCIQSVLEAKDVKPRSMELTINQFCLVLTEETMQSMTVDGAFKDGGVGADESGSRDNDGGDMVMGSTQ
ncbi:hypothetical protein L873DRAFT_1905901 [Choiromyces venosus 120613-1]|uniref:Uncharacterized protein n=1 Tax=Choiromyces venosus 120613-1 TaxID=1336337 RepID=A0A3N4IRW7_9PEZI|nr:hypothetical protein L873DRAFT_1905901 [Choiromyces venosus 120613-1]